MRALPTFPELDAPETTHERAHRLLLWIVQHGVTVTLSDVDLQRADVAACAAVIAATDEDMRQRISFRRHQMLAELRIRRSLERQAQQAQSTQQRPNAGPMASLSPKPETRPPSPVRQVEPVDIAF